MTHEQLRETVQAALDVVDTWEMLDQTSLSLAQVQALMRPVREALAALDREGAGEPVMLLLRRLLSHGDCAGFDTTSMNDVSPGFSDDWYALRKAVRECATPPAAEPHDESQCWELCGDLGKSAEHARPVPHHPELDPRRLRAEAAAGREGAGEAVTFEHVIGYMYAFACDAADRGQDIRKMECPAVLAEAKRDLCPGARAVLCPASEAAAQAARESIESQCLSEPDGMVALAIGVAEQRWPHTTDARAWARQWMEHIAKTPTIPTCEETMVGWFANAIMAGYDTAAMRAQSADAQDAARYRLIRSGDHPPMVVAFRSFGETFYLTGADLDDAIDKQRGAGEA